MSRREQSATKRSAVSRGQPKNHMFSEASFVKMYYFAIAFQMEMP
jgi:hypothetical protein